MTYDHAHPDAEIFKEGSQWTSKEKTLGDYIAKKHPYPCVVIGGEYPSEPKNEPEKSA